MKRRALFWSLGSVAALVILGLVWLNARPPQDDMLDGVRIPREGLLLNPAGENPGDPRNAEQDLKRFYTALIAFRQKHNRMPRSPWELLEAGKDGEVDLNSEDFVNPDVKYSDNETVRKELAEGKPIDLNRSYNFDWLAEGPDVPKRNVPPDAPKVRWMSSSSYERSNGRVFPGMKYRFEPNGYTISLWSNGEITREGPDERFWVKTGPGEWSVFDPAVDSRQGKTVVTERELLKMQEEGRL